MRSSTDALIQTESQRQTFLGKQLQLHLLSSGWLAARKENRGKALETSPGLTSLFLNPVERHNCAKAKHLSERGHECRSSLGRNRSVEESEAP